MNKESRFKYHFVVLWQSFEWICVAIFTSVWRFKVRLPQTFPQKPFLIVANHKTMLDPWFFILLMPFKEFRAYVPFRFVASQAFPFLMRVFVKAFIYFPNGVTPLPRRDKTREMTIDEKVASTLYALEQKEVALVFPEGHMIKKPGVHTFKRGAAYLQQKTGVPIMLASIRFEKNRFLPGRSWMFPWVQRTINWSEKEVFIPEEILHTEIESGEWLRNRVEELYNKL